MTFYNRLVRLKHSGYLIHKILNDEDNRPFDHSVITLIISDWTGAYETSKEDITIGQILFPKGTRWDKPFPSGSHHEVDKSNWMKYSGELVSDYYQYLYVQAFESMQKSWKDILRHDDIGLLSIDQRIRNNDLITTIKRLIKHDGNTIRFSEIETILSECRHAITHSQSLLNHDKVLLSKTHTDIFMLLFDSIEYTHDKSRIKLNYPFFAKLIDFTANFNFQIYKYISINKNWSIIYGFKGYQP